MKKVRSQSIFFQNKALKKINPGGERKQSMPNKSKKKEEVPND
jgi:hypothetical protein